MSINGVSSYHVQNCAIQNRSRSAERNSSISDDEWIGNATSLSESSDNGKKIGVTTVGNIGYIAMYADSSTEQDPIIKVGDYEIRIKDVNPNNATKMEMFALMSYMDDKGLTNNQGMSSFSKMTAYSTQAEYNGYCSGIADENAAWTVERDWIGILGSAKETFLGNSQTYEQGLECEKLIGNLEKWNQVRSYSDTEAIDKIQNVAQVIPIQSGEEGVARLEHGIAKIVRTVNPEDGKEYVTYFTKNHICCKWTEGDNEASWTMEITEEQYALIDKYFDKYNSGKEDEQLWYSGDEFGMVSSKEYWLGFFEGAEAAEDVMDISDEEYMELIRKQIEEMQEKLDNGEVNESFQIGAQTFTIEEWQNFLEKFDSIQEAIEALMKERHAKLEKQNLNKEEEKIDEIATEMIVSESTSCSYPSSDADGEEVRYITWYTEEGIFCRKAGQLKGYEWSIPFENKELYDKVMEFLGQVPSDWNLRFTAHENFWQDFLNDEIDMDGFMEFLNGTNKGIPDFSITEGNSMYIDKDKAKWAKYTNPLDAKIYTAEEMQEVIDKEIQKNQYKKKSLYEMIIDSCPEGANATFCFAGESKIYSIYEYIEELERRSGEISLDSVSAKSNTRRTEIKVSNFKEYETANYKFVPEPTIGNGGMRILKNGQSVAVFSVDNLKIRVDEETGTRVLISEMPGFGRSWYDAIPVDAELERGLAEAIGVEVIPEVELEGYYIGTHAGTGIQYVMRPGDEGRGGKVLLRNERDVAKYNALAEEYYNHYPNLVSSQEYGRIYASLEICGMMERTETGILKIGYDNISYNDNYDYKKNWSAMLKGNTWELLSEWLKENREHMKELQKFSSWRDVFDKIGGSYERVWSDEEILQGYLNN